MLYIAVAVNWELSDTHFILSGVLNLSAWKFMSAHIKICVRYMQSHSFVCYSSVEFKESKGPGTL